MMNLCRKLPVINVMIKRNVNKWRVPQNVKQINIFKRIVNFSEKPKVPKMRDESQHIISKGAPQLEDDCGKTISRRMRVLNKHFIECITDVLATDEILKDIRELEIRITHVHTTIDATNLNIYWVSSLNIDVKSIDFRLTQLSRKLRQSIYDRNIMGKIPLIDFIYDQTESHVQSVENLLRDADFGDGFEPKLPPKQVNHIPETTKDETSGYTNLRMLHPSDMRMDVLGLNYAEMVSVVMENLKKSRANHRTFNAVADPLPPHDWSVPIINQNVNIGDTDLRIKSMKTFLVENRKKRQKMSRDARKQQILNQLLVDNEMVDAKERYDETVNDDYDYYDDE